MNNTNSTTKSQKIQKRRKVFNSPEAAKMQLADDLYRLRQYSAEDIADAFGVTRQTLRNRQVRSKK